MKHGSPERGRAGGSGRRHAGARRRVGQAASVENARYGQLWYLVVLLGVAAGLLVIRQGVGFVQSGTLVLGGVLLIAALARLILPERRAGLLSSRRRALDVAIFGVLGIGLLVAGFVVPVPR